MIRARKENKVEASGNFKRHEFRVDTNADMFQLIISNLYSRPVEAIVRELSCNAHDSHVAAGNGARRFDIKLPNSLDHTFYIRDYGTGLTPDKIYNLYTVVGLSDKTGSDEFTGSFGVGSKSPFAYTNQFSVESVVDGVKWVYSAFMNEAGIPEIADISEGGFPTEEPNGVKISFDINRNDWNEFYNVCRTALYPFALKPNVLGIEKERVLAEIPYTYEGDGWRLASKSITGHGSYGPAKCYAIMGNVLYEIDESQFPGLNQFRGVELLFNIGEVTPAASREHLQYDEKTILNINQKLEAIRTYFKDYFLGKLQDCKTLFEARVKYKKFTESPFGARGSFCYNIIENAVAAFKFNKKTFDLRLNSVSMREVCEGLPADKKEFHVYSFTNGKRTTVAKPGFADWHKVNVITDYWSSANMAEAFFVTADEQYCKISKTRHLSEQNYGKTFYFFDTDSDQIRKNLIKFGGVGESQFKKVSELAKAPVVARQKTVLSDKDKQKDAIRIYNTNYAYNLSEIWASRLANDEEISSFGVYVVRDRYKWSYLSEKDAGAFYKDLNSMKTIARTLSSFNGLPHIPIYSITAAKLDLVPENWIPLETFLEQFYEWILSGVSEDLDLNAAYKKVIQLSAGSAFQSLVENAAIFGSVKDPELAKWINKLSSIAEANKTYDNIERLRKLLKQEPLDATVGSKTVDEFRKFYKGFCKKYELFDEGLISLSSYTSAKQKQAVHNYISIMHKQEQK